MLRISNFLLMMDFFKESGGIIMMITVSILEKIIGINITDVFIKIP